MSSNVYKIFKNTVNYTLNKATVLAWLKGQSEITYNDIIS